MREKGVVIGIDGKYIDVKIDRKSACGGNCAECGGCMQKGSGVRAKNPGNVKKGDIVELELNSGRVLHAAFLVYILPLIIFICGYCIAGFVVKNNIICAAAGGIFMIISFFLLHAYDKKTKEKYMPEAVLCGFEEDAAEQ